MTATLTVTAGDRVQDNRSGAFATVLRTVGQDLFVRYDIGVEVYRPLRVMTKAA